MVDTDAAVDERREVEADPPVRTLPQARQPQMEQQVVMGLETLADDDGVRLLPEVAAALQQCEDHCQQYIARNKGETPLKPYKVTVEIEVLATGRFGRAVTWKTEAKMPPTGQKRTVHAKSKDGQIIMSNPAGQKAMQFPVPPDSDEE